MTSELQSGPTDLLFVLAGAKVRKLLGISEFNRGIARRLILSTGRFELRRFPDLPIQPSPDLLALAARIPAPKRHCFVVFPPGDEQVVWIKVKRFGTMSEIEALREWLLKHGDVRRVTILSSGYHLRRIRLCCRFVLPEGVETSFLALTGEKVNLRSRVLELAKTLVYMIILTLSLPRKHFQAKR